MKENIKVSSRGIVYYRSLSRKYNKGLLEPLEVEDYWILHELVEDLQKARLDASEMFMENIEALSSLDLSEEDREEGLVQKPIIRRLFEAGYIEQV